MADEKKEDDQKKQDLRARVGRVVFVSSHSAMVLDVKGGKVDNSTPIIQYTWHGGENQQWYIERKTDCKYVVIRSMKSGKVLDISGGKCANSAPIVQNHFNGDDSQLWVLDTNSDPKDKQYELTVIRSKMNEKYCIDIKGASKDNSAIAILYEYKGSGNQLFGMIDNSLQTKNVVILAAHSNMVLELRDDKAVQGKFEKGKKTQVFNIEESRHGSKTYYIECVGSGKVLDDPKWSKNDVQIIGYKKNKGENQLWRFSNIFPGCWQITNVYSGKVLDVSGRSKDDGGKIIQYKNNKTPNQMWAVRNSGEFRIVYVDSTNLKQTTESLGEYYKTHKGNVSTQVSDNDTYKVLYVSASAGKDEGIMYVVSAEAEAGVMKVVNDTGNAFESVDVGILNAKAAAWAGAGAGFELTANLVDIQASLFYANLGLGIDSGVGFKDDSFQLEALGIGFTIGRKIGISVFGTGFGIDFGKLSDGCSIM